MGIGIYRKFGRPKKCSLCFFLLLLAIGGTFYRYTTAGFLDEVSTYLKTGRASISRAILAGEPASTGLGSKQLSTTNYKTILAWTTKSGKTKWIPNTLKNLNCRVSNCRVTEDRSVYPEADVIVFHAKDVNEDDLPPEEPNQRATKIWALLNHEPPPQTMRHTFAFLANQIDWTISYRKDSTVYAPIYESRSKKKNKHNDQQTKFSKDTKRKMATWLVSHCKTSSNREGFVAELKRHLQVDVWGKCGKKLTTCPQNERIGCYSSLSRKYKFYLSLENSICFDYVTEKVFLALQAGIVPVVFGGAQYDRFLPPKSYINALSFPNVKSLARHLERVGKNESVYGRYLNWQKKYDIVERRYKWLCDVCEKLDSDEGKPKDEKIDLLDWWFVGSKCKRWRNGTLIDYE